MKTTQATRADTFADEPHFEGEERPHPMAWLETTKVIREQTPVHGDGGLTFGQFLDNHLTKCAKEGVEVQDVKFSFVEGVWQDLAETLRQRR